MASISTVSGSQMVPLCNAATETQLIAHSVEVKGHKSSSASTIMTDNCVSRLHVFLDISLLTILLLTAFALHRQVATKQIPPKLDSNTLYDHQNHSFRRSTIVFVLIFELWGVLGLVLSSAHNCSTSYWLVILCLSLSIGCVLVGFSLGLREMLLTFDYDVRQLQSLQLVAIKWFLPYISTTFSLFFFIVSFTIHYQALMLLSCLRCSCFSRLTKRVLLLPPLALLAILNLESWLESRSIETCSTSELLPPPTFFVGVASLFVAMFITTFTTVSCSISSLKCRTSSRQVSKTLVALGLTLFALSSIGWAAVGFLILHKSRDSEQITTTLSSVNCWSDLLVRQAAKRSIAQLLIVGGLLFVTTFCCRIENFFLAPNVPEIDMTQLSPRLKNLTIKSPEEDGDGKVLGLRTPEDVTVVV